MNGGTRLRPRMLVDEDGNAVPYDIYDTTAAATCQPFGANDGNVFCVVDPPIATFDPCHPVNLDGARLDVHLVDIGGGLATRVYAGADGSRFPANSFYDVDRQVRVDLAPITGQDDRPLLPPYGSSTNTVTYYESDACDPSGSFFLAIDGCTLKDDTRYVRLGDRTFSTMPEDVTAYACYSIEGMRFVDSFALHALRAVEVPIESWKLGTATRAGVGRYRYRAWQVGCVVTPWQNPAVLFDTRLGDQPCSPAVAEDQVLRCLPAQGTARAGFADAQCTQRVVIDQQPNAKAPYLSEGLPSGVPNVQGPIRVWEVGSEIPGAGSFMNPVYEKTGSGCTLLDPLAGTVWIAYEYGSVVPPSTFGALRIEVR
jgi:hypothetical protein